MTPWPFPSQTHSLYVPPNYYGMTFTVYTWPPASATWADPLPASEPTRFVLSTSHRYIPVPVARASEPMPDRLPRQQAREHVAVRARARARQSVPARTRRRTRTWERA